VSSEGGDLRVDFGVEGLGGGERLFEFGRGTGVDDSADEAYPSSKDSSSFTACLRLRELAAGD